MTKQKLGYDPKIMDALLNEPKVHEQVLQMRPKELKLFKELLVSQGIYARYILEIRSKSDSKLIVLEG